MFWCFQVRDLSVAYVLVGLTYLYVGVLIFAAFPSPPLFKDCIEPVRSYLFIFSIFGWTTTVGPVPINIHLWMIEWGMTLIHHWSVSTGSSPFVVSLSQGIGTNRFYCIIRGFFTGSVANLESLSQYLLTLLHKTFVPSPHRAPSDKSGDFLTHLSYFP